MLPAHHVKVGNLAGTECELPRLDRRTTESSAPTRPGTPTRRITYEFMPYDAVVNTLDSDARGRGGGRTPPNGGLALDTWHLGKLDLAPDDLRRIPPRLDLLGDTFRRPVRDSPRSGWTR